MVASEELGSHAGVRLGDEVFVYHSSDVSLVVGDVLHAHFMGGSANPVTGSLAMVAVYVFVNFGGNGQFTAASEVSGYLQSVEVFGAAAGKADFFVNATGSLSEEFVLGGHMACVAWQVLSSPAALVAASVLSLRSLGSGSHLTLCKNYKHQNLREYYLISRSGDGRVRRLEKGQALTLFAASGQYCRGSFV